jgi:hypothetical protein
MNRFFDQEKLELDQESLVPQGGMPRRWMFWPRRGGAGVSWVWSPPGKSGDAGLFRCAWG